VNFFGGSFFSSGFFDSVAGTFFGGQFFSGGFFDSVATGASQLLIKLRSFTERGRF
jgi:hypothetical protein